ncbi:MAG TPA: PP2C family serine/threonine-protein phosphatase [Burkholderiales bacterium]|nr:PP2C family serine/threonine-protein phosphatase [Burkholderiales bacterium]
MKPASEAAAQIRLGNAPNAPLLGIRIGHASRAAPNKSNEDCYGIVTPAEEPEAASRGVAVAIADGSSAAERGRLASETTVKTLLRDYYGTSAAWNVAQALERVLRSVNDWLFRENVRRAELGGAVTTLSMTVFRDSRYYLVHVGDTRIYRKRGAALRQLTADHTWQRSDMRHVLKRAVGLDGHLVVDFSEGELRPGDTFLLASDGVWEVLGDRVLMEVLEGGGGPGEMAEQLTQRSVRGQAQYMGRNDATAVVVAVEEWNAEP